MIVQMLQTHCSLPGKREEKKEGNKERRKDYFIAVLSNKIITLK